MPSVGSYEVWSIDHPEKVVVVNLEVVDREIIEYAHFRIRQLEQIVRLQRDELEKLRRAA